MIKDIRIYLLWLFLGLAFEDNLFFRMGVIVIVIDYVMELIMLWRNRK